MNKFAVFSRFARKKFQVEKNPTSTFKIGGFGDTKMFRKSFETSLIISLKKDNLPILAVLRKKISTGKYSNFKFQKSGNFGSNSLQVIGTFSIKFLMGNRRFFETTSEAKCPDKPRSGVAKLFYLNHQSCTFSAEAVWT